MVTTSLRESRSKALAMMLFLLVQYAAGQQYALDAASEVRILGTSTLHDWEMKVTGFSGSFTISEADGMEVLDALVFEVEATGLIAEHPKMQRDAHKALEAEEYPIILFRQQQSFPVGLEDSGARPEALLLNGSLNVKGQEQQYEIPVRVRWAGPSVLMKGSVAVDMTAFGVEPPKAMLGIIRTSEEVEVQFDLRWEKK